MDIISSIAQGAANMLEITCPQCGEVYHVEKIAFLDLESLTSPRLVDANPHLSGGVQFTPDGKGIAYPVRENGVDNVWVQALDGSAGHPITHFDSEQIDSFHWSPDGKSLALLRGHSESDVVLLQQSRP